MIRVEKSMMATKSQKRFILSVSLVFISVVLLSCTDDTDSNNTESGKSNSSHIWEQQIDVLKSAKDAAQKFQDTLDQNKQKLDESN